MNNLGPKLEKFARLKPADQEVKEVIAEVIFKHTGVPISAKEVRLSHFTVYLKDPIARREAFLKQTKILTELRELLDQKSPQELR